MKVSNHCYIVAGLAAEPPWTVNAGFVVGGQTTLIVDSGSNYLSAQTIHGYACCAAPENTLIAVNTEPHFDHIGGNCFLQEKGIIIYAHSELRRTEEEFQQTKHDYNNAISNIIRKNRNEADFFFYKTILSNPTNPLYHNQRFNLGGLIVSKHETPGHTPLNISLFVEEDRVLFCGDALITGYMPNLESGNPVQWRAWLQSLDLIERLSPDFIIPGHGPCIGGADDIHAALKRTRNILEKAISDNKAPTL